MKRWFSLFLVLISAGAALAQPPRPAEFRPSTPAPALRKIAFPPRMAGTTALIQGLVLVR